MNMFSLASYKLVNQRIRTESICMVGIYVLRDDDDIIAFQQSTSDFDITWKGKAVTSLHKKKKQRIHLEK